MEENPPLFLQNSRCITHHHGFVLSSFFLIFLNPWFVFFATVTFGLVLFYSHPPILSFPTYILHPNHITKGWDYLIPLLVLFAIICSFLNQNNSGSDDDPKSNQETTSSIHPQIPKWLDQYTERGIYNENYQIVVEEPISSDHKMVGRLRSSISYPDLRQEEWISRSDRWQFSDDIDLNDARWRRSDHHRRSRHHRRREVEGDGGATIDNFLVHTRVDGSSAHPPPAPAPSQVVKKDVCSCRTLQKWGKEDGELEKEREKQELLALNSPPPENKVGRALQKVGKEYRESDKEKENQQTQALNSPPLPPPPPPPCRPPPCRHVSKKSSGAKDIANALAHLYNKKKNSYNHALCSPSSSNPAAPPPPPPQHSPSIFYNLFKKSSKSKRIHSFTPPPPPPPPRKKITPPSPASTNVYEKEDDLHRGSESPLIWMPPPPRSPPIEEKKLKFEVLSGHVGVSSGLSDCLDTENAGMSMIYGGDESVGLSPSGNCSSPDVNSEADKFIARFHESLRRENVNFIKEKERTRLGGAVTM